MKKVILLLLLHFTVCASALPEDENVASVEHPVDMTSWIVNPRFDNNDVTTGWSGDIFFNYHAMENAECYSRAYNIFQQIKGLPRGVYAIGVKAFHLAGDLQDGYKHYKANDEVSNGARLYAITSIGQRERAIVSIFDNHRTEAAGCKGEECVTDKETGQTYWVPFQSLEAAGFYMHELDCYDNRLVVMVDDSLTIGVKNDKAVSCDWSVFDDFSLTYYGNGSDTYQLYLDDARKEYDGSTIAEGTLYTDAYLEETQRQHTATSMEEATATLAALKQAYADLQANIALWKEWQTITATGRSIATTPVYNRFAEAQQLAARCTEEAAAIEEERKLTNQELTEAIKQTEAMIDGLYYIEDAPGRMLVEGRQWEYSRHHNYIDYKNGEPYQAEIVTSVTYTLCGDTLIDGKSYKKLYEQEENEAPAYAMALREEGRTLYGRPKDLTREIRFMELNPSNLIASFQDLFFIDATEQIDVVTVDGRPFVRHNYTAVTMAGSKETLVSVEGVGLEYTGIFCMWYSKYPTNDYLVFEACHEDGKCIFRASDFYKKADETSDIAGTKTTPHPAAKGCFDLRGRRLNTVPAKGIYIKDGRKYMSF